MHGQVHKRDGAEPLVLKRTRQKAERVRRDSRASAGVVCADVLPRTCNWLRIDLVKTRPARYDRRCRL